jgi:hypothetical protein
MRTTVEKIEYLRKLLSVYLKFSRHYSSVDVKVSGESFMVRWSEPKHQWYDFETIEVPLEDLDRRIISYRGKLNREFKKRNGTQIVIK